MTVIEKPARRGGIVRYELNRVLTGTGHEVYRAGDVIVGDRPPDELARHLRAAGLETPTLRGLTYNPMADTWSLSADTDVNYLAAAAKPD